MSAFEVPRPEHVETLWSRIDHNRIKLALFFGGLLLAYAASAGIVVYLGALLLMVFGFLRGAFWTSSSWNAVHSPVLAAALAAAGIAFMVGVIQIALSLVRSERRVLGHLGAVRTETGQQLVTKDALKDMSLAAGFAHAPPLWIIPGCARVNAFALGRNRAHAVVGVTEGFTTKLTHDEQRAVFANVMAKVARGNTVWATGVASVVGPLWRLRERDLRAGDEECLIEPRSQQTAEFEAAQFDLGLLAVPIYAPVVILTELLLAGHQRSAILSAEEADAEGMLLLKDPCEMLETLVNVLNRNHTVPSAGEAYSLLFYAWAGFGFAPEDDPEMERVARLREVLGAEGMAQPADDRWIAPAVANAEPPEASRASVTGSDET